MLPDCSQLPAWVRWIAQDADGTWWGYEHEPNQGDRGWYENEVGSSIRLKKDPANPHWSQAIYKL
jgi:hypothetical protein